MQDRLMSMSPTMTGACTVVASRLPYVARCQRLIGPIRVCRNRFLPQAFCFGNLRPRTACRAAVQHSLEAVSGECPRSACPR